MNNGKTFRLLVLSMVSLLLCVLMLIGSTFAWFTTVKTSGNNVIRTGTFDVDVYYHNTYIDVDADGWVPFEGGLIFNGLQFLPGSEAVRYIKFTNTCSYQVKYQVVLPELDATTTLTDALQVYYKDTGVTAEITTVDMTPLNDYTLTTLSATADASSHNAPMFSVTVDPGQAAIAAVGFKLPTTYADEQKEANFKLRVIATQNEVTNPPAGPTWPELPVNATLNVLTPDSIDYTNLNDANQTVTVVPDAVVEFASVDTAATIDESPYKDYKVDFELSFDKDVHLKDVTLVGNYGDYGWLGLVVSDDPDAIVAANASTPIMGSVVTTLWSYKDIVTDVQSFKCAIRVEGMNVTATLKLMMYDPNDGTPYVIYSGNFPINNG